MVSHLRYIRKDLTQLQHALTEDGLLLEATKIRGVLAQMEVLLEVLEGQPKVKQNTELI